MAQPSTKADTMVESIDICTYCNHTLNQFILIEEFVILDLNGNIR